MMKSKIKITFEYKKRKVNLIKRISKNILKECLKEYKDIIFSINLIVTTNKKIKEYNNKYRDINKKTDVLSFPMLENDNGKLSYKTYDIDMTNNILFLGDIIISNQLAVEQAKSYNHSYKREFAFLLTHGILHLLGYDHEKQEEELIMKNKQKEILDKVGYTR